MTNQLTLERLKELLQIQKDFDSRIPTLNLQDSKIAYVVEFFEWFNFWISRFSKHPKNSVKKSHIKIGQDG